MTARRRRPAQNGHAALVRDLLARGAGLDARSRGGMTALAYAAVYGQADTLRALLDAGADVNGDGAGTPPLLHAAAANLDVVRLLLDRGADVERRNADGQSALTVAASTSKDAIVDFLLTRNARLRSEPAGSGPIWHAALRGRASTLRRLLAVPGADVNDTAAHDGTTALAIAARLGHEDAVDVLLAHGADVHRTGTALQTALAEAASGGHVAIMARLVTAGAAIDGRGTTILALARELRAPQTVATLERYGAR